MTDSKVSCAVLSRTTLFVTMSFQLIDFKIFLCHLWWATSSFLVLVTLTDHISAPYNRTDKTWKSLSKMLKGVAEGLVLEFRLNEKCRVTKIKQWRKFLDSSNNKSSLISFLVDEWKSTENREKLSNKTLYVTNKEACYRLGPEGWEDIKDLTSSQEEADSSASDCMLLHASRASKQGHKSLIIV